MARPQRESDLHVVVLDRYAEGRIVPAPQWFRYCTVRERVVLEKPHTPGPVCFRRSGERAEVLVE